MILAGENRSTGNKCVPLPFHQHKFHTDLPGSPKCVKPVCNYLKLQLLVNMNHILFIFS